MRALVISDIHGNVAALEAVAAEPHDFVICLGDIAGYGPEPARCVEWIRANSRTVVQGNHDRAVGLGIDPRCSARFRDLALAAGRFAERQLAPDEKRYLADLPPRAELDLGDRGHLLVHATPTDPLYRYVGPQPEAWERELADVRADVVLVGHTHLQFSIPVPGRLVVNPGSVGQPKDGDPRAAYAVIDGGRIELKRASYDVERTARLIEGSDIGADAIRDLTSLLRTGRVPDPPS